MRLLALVVVAWGRSAGAEPAAQGFALERLYTAPAGAGWFVMDDLDLHGGLGGALSMTFGYAHDPLRLSDGATHLDVVSSQVLTDIGASLVYDRWRFSLDVQTELDTAGTSGFIGGYAFTGPDVNPGAVGHPDTLGDPRVGIDVRLLGEPGAALRLGASAQLWIPNGDRADYDTDGTFRGMVRGLAAGDIGTLAYAAQVGVHVRPLDDPSVPGSPRGSELLFGVAGGEKVSLSPCWRVVIGAELFGASALTSIFAHDATALEALASARLEGTRRGARQLRVKLGIGGGNTEFGAPDWRVVTSVEMFGRQR
jgi:hypothetical protein